MPLIEKLLIIAMFAQAAIAFVLLPRLRVGRVKAYKAGGVSMADAAIDQSVWPLEVRKIQNCYNNQFEQPVLFYAVCLLALQTGAVSWLFDIMALAYVVIRWVHMFIHTGSNHVPTRMKIFALSFFVLVAMWIVALAHVLVSV